MQDNIQRTRFILKSDGLKCSGCWYSFGNLQMWVDAISNVIKQFVQLVHRLKIDILTEYL